MPSEVQMHSPNLFKEQGNSSKLQL